MYSSVKILLYEGKCSNDWLILHIIIIILFWSHKHFDSTEFPQKAKPRSDRQAMSSTKPFEEHSKLRYSTNRRIWTVNWLASVYQLLQCVVRIKTTIGKIYILIRLNYCDLLLSSRIESRIRTKYYSYVCVYVTLWGIHKSYKVDKYQEHMRHKLWIPDIKVQCKKTDNASVLISSLLGFVYGSTVEP